MRFLNPEASWWLAVVPILITAWIVHARARARLAAQLGWRLPGRRREIVLLALALIGAGAVIFALARPQIRREIDEPQFATVDVVLLVDRSASMFATDVAPTRFARAIAELRRLLSAGRERFGRVALIEFSSSALVLSTFTRDLDAIAFYLGWIQEDTTLRFGTDLVTALTQARELIGRDRQATRKVVVIVSDGDSQETELAESLTALSASKIPVFTAAIGVDSRAPILMRAAGGVPSPVTDDAGRPLSADTDPTILEQIARMTGGRFVSAPAGVGLADRLAEAIGRTPSIVGTSRVIKHRDLYRPALFVAAMCAAAMVFIL